MGPQHQRKENNRTNKRNPANEEETQTKPTQSTQRRRMTKRLPNHSYPTNFYPILEEPKQKNSDIKHAPIYTLFPPLVPPIRLLTFPSLKRFQSAP